MKYQILISILFLAQILSGQSNSNGVVECVLENYKQINFDYQAAMDSLLLDMKEKRIIDSTQKSYGDSFSKIVGAGFFDMSRTYENVTLEALGLRTISYCINKINHVGWLEDTDLLIFMDEMKTIYSPTNLKDFIQLRKKTAIVLNKYASEKESMIWNWLSLHYMYLLSETEEMKKIVKTASPFK